MKFFNQNIDFIKTGDFFTELSKYLMQNKSQVLPHKKESLHAYINYRR